MSGQRVADREPGVVTDHGEPLVSKSVSVRSEPKTVRRQRSELNAARTSAEKSSGSSQAAKWPPLSTSLK